MGSPLGVLFANFYMGSLEEKIFTQQPDLKPPIYTRYIDDIFINASSEEHVTQLIDIFKNNSALNFTHEIARKRPATLIPRRTGTPPRKQFLDGNAASECPDKYRRSVINSFVKRVFTHCSSCTTTVKELNRISQILTNNGYSKDEVDDVIRHRMNNYVTQARHLPIHQSLLQKPYVFILQSRRKITRENHTS